MKSRLARLGVLLVAVVGIMGTMTPPASANPTVKVVAFVGTATVGALGLGYPCTETTGTTNPIDTSKCPVIGTGNHKTFGFASDPNGCVKVSLGIKKTGVDLCSISATGTVWGWCGLSTGVGVASLINLTGTAGKPTGEAGLITTPFKFVGVGGLLVVTGGFPKGANIDTIPGWPILLPGGAPGNTWVAAVVLAVPAVTIPTTAGPSCTNKTGTLFNIAGVALVRVN